MSLVSEPERIFSITILFQPLEFLYPYCAKEQKSLSEGFEYICTKADKQQDQYELPVDDCHLSYALFYHYTFIYHGWFTREY